MPLSHPYLTQPGLYPFDSLRSLRVTVFLRFILEMMSVGGRHPERGNLFPSRTGITSEGQDYANDSSILNPITV